MVRNPATTSTQLATPNGPQMIETLRVGDLVETLDHGAQPIRWIGRSTVLPIGKMSPVCIAKGALGCGLPKRELRVSQQHRMLVRSPIIKRMTGSDEALIAAKFLGPMAGIDLKPDIMPVTYLHLLFDCHEIVVAEGAPTESLFPGPQALQMLGPDCSDQLNTLLPQMDNWRNGGVPARIILEGSMRHKAVIRHLKNSKPVLVSAPSLRLAAIAALPKPPKVPAQLHC